MARERIKVQAVMHPFPHTIGVEQTLFHGFLASSVGED